MLEPPLLQSAAMDRRADCSQGQITGVILKVLIYARLNLN